VYGVNHDMSTIESQRLRGGEGCPCCFGQEVEHRPERAIITAELMTVLGDDMDGLAATLEDFGI